MTLERAQAWLSEVEDMMKQEAHLTTLQEEELRANYRAALVLYERALMKANQLKVDNGHVVGPAERYCFFKTMGGRCPGKGPHTLQ